MSGQTRIADKAHRPENTAGLPEGPSWEQIQRLIANLNTERPSHIRDRANLNAPRLCR